MTRAFSTALAAPLALVTVATTAAATDEASRRHSAELRTTHGMAEFGVGVFTLPGANVCIERSAGCSKGDSSLSLSAWPLFRRGNFAAGAGVMLGVASSTDAPHVDPIDVPRDHTRRYLSIEMTGRYYVPVTPRIDLWLGVTTGLGVVNDTFQTRRGVSERAMTGMRGTVLLTEGFTVGLGTGVAVAVTDNWRVGGALRVSSWFLPHAPLKDPLGDEASLTGRVTTIDLAITVAYRSRLMF